MENNLNPMPEQVSAPQRVADALRNGYENVRRNLSTYVAIGASAAALTGSEMAVNAESSEAAFGSAPALERSNPGFKPGRYEGTTNQICTPEAATKELCVEGEKTPITFTATKSKLVKLTSVALEECFDSDSNKLPDTALPMVFSKPVKVIEARGGGFIGSAPQAGGIIQQALAGNIKGTKARGSFGLSVSLNENGKLDKNGDIFCQSDIAHWTAKRVK